MKKNNIPVLEIKNLCVGYMRGKKPLPVVENINFSLGKGVLAAIVGVNGIGKSTLLLQIYVHMFSVEDVNEH